MINYMGLYSPKRQYIEDYQHPLWESLLTRHYRGTIEGLTMLICPTIVNHQLKPPVNQWFNCSHQQIKKQITWIHAFTIWICPNMEDVQDVSVVLPIYNSKHYFISVLLDFYILWGFVWLARWLVSGWCSLLF